jgi:hypothetical protein
VLQSGVGYLGTVAVEAHLSNLESIRGVTATNGIKEPIIPTPALNILGDKPQNTVALEPLKKEQSPQKSEALVA